MPRKLFAAISQIVLGALIAIAPQTFAHVCAVKDMPMACRYTARVALGLGVVIALLAIIGFFAPSRVRVGLDLANAVLGVLVVLVPTMLVGVCRGSMMHCHMDDADAYRIGRAAGGARSSRRISRSQAGKAWLTCRISPLRNYRWPICVANHSALRRLSLWSSCSLWRSMEAHCFP